MDNATRKQLLQRHKQSGFPGSIMDVFDAYKKGIDIIGQFEQQQQAQQPKIAKTPQEQKQGLRPDHQAGNINQSMAFPNMPPNSSFNTVGMKAPIDLKQFDQKGNLVASYDKVPPGVTNLKMSSQGGTVLETPSQMKNGGIRKFQSGDFLQSDSTRVSTPTPQTNPTEFKPAPRMGVRQNPGGSVSTHKYATETLDGENWFSFPTLFQNPDSSWIDMEGDDWYPAYEEALRRGEVLDFGKDKQRALDWGIGSWKEQKKTGGVRKYQGAGFITASATTPDWRATGPSMRINNQIYQPSELTGGTRIMANPETGDLLPIMLPAAEVYSDTNDPNALATDSIETALSKTGSGMMSNFSNMNDYLYDSERLDAHRKGFNAVYTGAMLGATIGSLGTAGNGIQLGARGIGGLSNAINSSSSFLGTQVSNAIKYGANAILKNPLAEKAIASRAGQIIGTGLNYGQKGLNYLQAPGKWIGNAWNSTKLGQNLTTLSNTAIPGFSGMTLSSGLKSASTVLGAAEIPDAIDKVKEGDLLGASAKIAKLPGFTASGIINTGKQLDAIAQTGIGGYNVLTGKGTVDDVVSMTKTIPGTSNIRTGNGLIKTGNSVLRETLKYGGVRKYQRGGFEYGEWAEVSRKVDPATGDIIITESRDGSRNSGYSGRGVNWEIGYRKWLSEGNKGSLADFKLAAEDWKKSQSKTEYDTQTRTRRIKRENEPNNPISPLQSLPLTEIPNEYTNNPILNPQSTFENQIFNNGIIRQPGQLGQPGLGGSGQGYANQQQRFNFNQVGLTPEELGETIVTTDPVTGEQYVQPFNIQSTSSLDTKSNTTIRGKNKKRTRFKENTIVAREDGTSSRTKNTQIARSKTGKDERIKGKTSYEEFDENGNRIIREVDRFKRGGKRKIKDRRKSRK